MIIHSFDLDMVPGGKKSEVYLNQYDSDFTLEVHLVSRQDSLTVQSGTTAAIRGTKPDGNGYSVAATVDAANDLVIVTGDQQMTAVAGRGVFELTLYYNDKELNTANFFLVVEPAALDKDSVSSESVVRELVNVIDNSAAIIAAGQQAANAQSTIEGYMDRAEAAAQDAEDDAAEALRQKNAAIVYIETRESAINRTIQDATDAIDEKAAAIVAIDTQANNKASQALSAANNAENSVAELSTSLSSIRRNQEAMQLVLAGKVDDAYVENGYLYLTSDGEIVAGPLGPFSGSGGGGGGSGNTAVLSVTNNTGWLSKTIAEDGTAPVTIVWSSEEDEMPTGDGTAKITVNGAVKAMLNIEQGTVSIDLAPYCSTGANVVKVTISDVYDNARTINFSITVVSISISSTFDATTPYTGAISFPYTPVGEVAKVIHFILDNTELDTVSTSVSGRQMTFTIPSQSHGAHTLEVYFSCTINSESVESNHLYYEFIALEPLNNTPIIVSSFNQSTAAQYATLNIPYTVYDPTSMNADVTISVNGTQASAQTVDRTEQTFAYRCDTVGALTVVIASGTASKRISLTVTDSGIDVEAETQNLALYLNSVGRSNNEADPSIWRDTDNNIAATLTGFNFTSDGWQLDEDGITVLRVAGDARVTIPYQIFGSDFRGTGKTIEVEFATRDVLNYDAVILSCLSEGRGLSMTAQKATLTSEQSEISMQYKEDEHVRLAFVAEKSVENRLLYVYVNGIMSGVVQYPADDDFQQTSPVGISIGSSYCTTDVYCIRVYDNDLTRYQILDNWIADSQNVDDLIERYTRNNIYDAYGNVVISNLPGGLPYMIIQCVELPQYKGDKKTCTVSYIDPITPSKSFSAVNVQIDVQGTSSQYYARKNYKMKYRSGFTLTQSGTQAATYALRTGAIATNTFTMKADVASSEGANNVELARLYNDVCPYQTPPQVENSAVRQGIDGFPIVIFWSDGTNTTFLGKYNFNNDKGTEEVFGFDSGDESWEIKNNTSDRVLWKSADYSGSDWLNDFEARYPDTDPAYTDATELAALAAWLVMTDQSAATGNALAEPYTDVDGTTHTVDNAAYRLAKFKTEAEDHFEMDSAIFYYLFTELFLMVDSRAKNAFPSHLGSDKWCFLPYDFDTALGINNEGALVFSYNLEDTDTTSGNEDVFNGQQSVLWINLRQAFYDEIKAMYQMLRSAGTLSYSVVETAFETHQNKWGEAIFNEDAWFKYIDPLANDGDGAYLSMAQGSKAEQRKWWLYNRFRYMDSKFNAGDAQSDVIQLRGYAKANVTVTPYADVYASVKFGSYLVQTRAARNTAYTLVCPLDNVNDTEIYIYSASQLAAVGDLSGLKVGFADFSMATKLQSIKVGDSSGSYSNPNLYSLSLGNNTLLRTLDVRNCSGLGDTSMQGHTQTSVDLSGCTNIEHVYFDGTSIAGLTLPNGGILKTLHLPSTITNLTIRNQSAITDFTLPSYSNITTLRLENVSATVDSKAIVNALAASSRVRLIGFNWTVADGEAAKTLLNKLATMRGLDENGNNTTYAQLSGTITVTTATGTQRSQIAALISQYGWTDVTMDYGTITNAIYYYDQDGTTLLHTEYVTNGGNGTWNGSPTKASTAQYTYTFVGWAASAGATSATSGVRNNITSDKNVYAAYSATVRTYTVYFYNGSTLLQTVNNVAYGGTATYTGSTPDDGQGGTFTGWSPSNANITGTTSCYAQFESASSVEVPTATSAAGAYGVEWNYANSSPALTRLGLAASFADPTPATALGGSGSSPFDSIQPWAGMKRYNIINGSVSYSEDDAGFSETDYDTVVYIPEFYYTAYKDTANSKWMWAISPTAKTGFVKHPGSGRYVGRFHTSGSSSAVYSKSGVAPLVNTTRTNFRTYSHNKGSKWYMLDIASWSALQMLYLVEFANFHSQNTLGTGWNTGSISNCGGTTGAAYHTLKLSGAHNQYRWVEDPFSNVYDCVDGFVASSRAVYTGVNNAAFTDAASSLTATGITLPSSNFITGLGYSQECPYAFIPDTASGGDASTYIPDRVNSYTGTRALYVGGSCGSNDSYGFFYFNASIDASNTYGNLGSRLLYIP